MSLLPLWRRDRKNELTSLEHEMNRVFDDFFGRPLGLVRGLWGDGEDAFLPPVDVKETEDKVIVEAELPGMDPKDVDIKIEGDTLLIGGERKTSKEENTKGFHRVERSFGRFQRQLDLPAGSDPEKVEATYKDGVLKIEIAKKEEAKRKTIRVNVK
jgi:HSP20 family protein